MPDARVAEAVAQLGARCVGRTINKVLVHGINSLKSAEPPLGDLAGVTLDYITPLNDSILEAGAGPFALIVDLQRTGRLRLDEQGKEWSIGQPSMPTVQFILGEGLAANFFEPAKTKRITLRVERRV
jgi:hypothetical protein